MPKSFQLVPPTKFPWYFLAGNVIGLGLSMVSSVQNRRYIANQQKFQCIDLGLLPSPRSYFLHNGVHDELSLDISVSGKAFYSIMLWRSRLNTSEASIRYSINLQLRHLPIADMPILKKKVLICRYCRCRYKYRHTLNYYIPECCLFLYTHCSHNEGACRFMLE